MKIKSLFNTTPTIQDYLSYCGVSNIEAYLNPTNKLYEPFEHYKNYDKAYECFMKHINSNDNISLYMDIDVDGCSASTIIYQLIQSLSECKIFPIFNDGKVHNLTDKIINHTFENNCKLLISPDAGANDFKAHKILKDKGVDVICLEHHLSDIESQDAIVVSNQLSPNVINKYLSGGGVSYKFAYYVCKQQKKKVGYKWIDLCALSIISDVMNLSSLENRMFLDIGLQHITNPFLEYLIANVVKNDLTPKDIGWSIAPLINSLIRQDDSDNKMRLFNAFIGIEKDYKSVLALCKKAHKEQNEIVKEMTQDIIKDVDDKNKVIIAFCEPSNYTGLVSARISSHFMKPVLLVHQNKNDYIGSLRSSIPMRDELNNSGLINWCNGHDSAAGISFPCENKDKLQEYLNTLEIDVDSEIIVLKSYSAYSISDSIFGLYNDYKYLYGNGIPEPLIHIKSFKIKGTDIQEIGNGSTIKFKINNVTFIQFFCTKEYKQSIHVGEKINLNIELLGVAQYNNWNGNQYPQIAIEKLECSTVNEKDFENLW